MRRWLAEIPVLLGILLSCLGFLVSDWGPIANGHSRTIYLLGLGMSVTAGALRLERRKRWASVLGVYVWHKWTTRPKFNRLLAEIIFGTNSEAIAGDLLERRTELARTSGRAFAYFWYWQQVILSVWAILRAALARLSGLDRVRRINR